MRRLSFVLSGLLLILSIFSFSSDVYAVKGYTTELMKSKSSRSYDRSSDPAFGRMTKEASGGKTSDGQGREEDTSGGSTQSKRGTPVDDGEKEEKITHTISPVTPPLTFLPAHILAMSPIENEILTNLAASESLSVQQENDQGHVSIQGNPALWLSDCLHGNESPVESLNRNRGRLYIPEFFREVLAVYIDAHSALQGDSGTLVWIEIEVPSLSVAIPAINYQMTIHYHINLDGDVQMNLYVGHINNTVGHTIIATTILSDNIDTSDLLQKQRSAGIVRLDSVTKTNVVIGDMKGMSPGNSGKGKKSGEMDSMEEGSRDSKQNNALTMAKVLIVNKTLAESQIKELYQETTGYQNKEWHFEPEGALKSF